MAIPSKWPALPDDETRGDMGVVVSLVDRGDGQVRLVFDDVAADAAPARAWRHHVLYTVMDCDLTRIRDHTLSDEQLRDIGFNLVIRLVALSRP
ncbi:MAG: hypothetical protein ACREO3_00900 [Arenimonas sp.]